MKTTWSSEIDVQDTTKKTTFYKYVTLSTFRTCYSQDSCFDLCAESQYPGYIAVQKDPCDSFHFCTAEILVTKEKIFSVQISLKTVFRIPVTALRTQR